MTNVVSARIVALAVALALGAGAMVTAQTGDTPGLVWVGGDNEILWIHQIRPGCDWVDRPAFNAGPDYAFYMHADPDDPCGSDTFTGNPKPVLTNSNPFKIHMQPFATEPIPLEEGGKVNITLHVFHQLHEALELEEPNSISYLQVQVNLSQGDAWSASDWAEPASVQQILEGKEWYEFNFQLDPHAPEISTAPFFLDVKANKCGHFDALCIAETGGFQSVGRAWRIGFEEGHRSFVELPLPDDCPEHHHHGGHHDHHHGHGHPSGCGM